MPVERTRPLLQHCRDRGSIRIAARWDVTAEQYLDPDTGAPAGVVGKVGTLVAGDLGVAAEFVELTWDDHIPALIDGRVDVCLKHTNTPDRALLVDFARGRLERYVGRIVVRHDRGWRGEASLDQPGRVIAATLGSHQETQARARYPRARVRTYPSAHDGMEAVWSRQADACLADAWIPNFLLLRPECETLTSDGGEEVVTSLDYAHPCIRKGDQEFLNWLDNWMDYHEAQGTFERIIAGAYAEHEAKFDRIIAPFLEAAGRDRAHAAQEGTGHRGRDTKVRATDTADGGA